MYPSQHLIIREPCTPPNTLSSDDHVPTSLPTPYHQRTMYPSQHLIIRGPCTPPNTSSSEDHVPLPTPHHQRTIVVATMNTLSSSPSLSLSPFSFSLSPSHSLPSSPPTHSMWTGWLLTQAYRWTALWGKSLGLFPVSRQEWPYWRSSVPAGSGTSILDVMTQT